MKAECEVFESEWKEWMWVQRNSAWLMSLLRFKFQLVRDLARIYDESSSAMFRHRLRCERCFLWAQQFVEPEFRISSWDLASTSVHEPPDEPLSD